MAFPDGTADFRSDTVTRPTRAMLEAMASAEVGDDVYADDPTVNRLQEEAAELVGKQAALFVPTGTMGNQLAIMLQTRPGDDVLCDEWAHVRNHEWGAGAALSGVGFRSLPAPGGQIRAEQVEEAMGPAGSFYPPIGLMVWENTHNASGGRVVPLAQMEETTAVARRHRLRVHLDGARLFNAAAATGVPAAGYAAVADTVMFCFSKGLGAPIGSILCGPADLIAEGRRLRKRLGGGMRQVGVIAAAARVALADRHRLGEDHQLARTLAAGLAERAPGCTDPAAVETNMVNVDPTRLPVPVEQLRLGLAAAGILTNPVIGPRWRLVTHRDVDSSDVDRLLKVLEQTLP